MAKGYWLVTTTVTNPAFSKHVEEFQPWVESVIRWFSIRKGHGQSNGRRKGWNISSDNSVPIKERCC